MKTRGFTLLELLVVLGIAAILAALTFPALARATDRGRRARCASQMRQVALAMQMYRDDTGKSPACDWTAPWDASLDPYTGGCGGAERLRGHAYYYVHDDPCTGRAYRYGVADNRHKGCAVFGWNVSVRTGEMRAWAKMPPEE